MQCLNEKGFSIAHYKEMRQSDGGLCQGNTMLDKKNWDLKLVVSWLQVVL
jgi:hypothetical protein